MASQASTPLERNIALCYVRLSQAPRIAKPLSKKEKRAQRTAPKKFKKVTDVSEMLDSPERQIANIKAACEKRGLIPEFYQDVDGHRSGTTERNRPGWLDLKKRIGAPGVAAVVANDLSRLHRKSARMSDLLDLLAEFEMDLILAAPGREVDTATPLGQMFVMMAAIFDELYAKDIAIRTRDSTTRRKQMGKPINLPFGTQRAESGYLEPSIEGAWLMPDGHYEMGYSDEPSPDEAALWRGYYDCARRMMDIYTENKYGAERIAYLLNLEGWAFKDRSETPRPIDKDDLRRVLHNWPEYGGLALGGHALHRSIHDVNADTVELVPERAVYPVELLLKVARVLRTRAFAPRNHGIKRSTRTYAMQGVLFCAHCEQRALKHDEPALRSKLWGKTAKDSRYRHQEGVKGCGCTNRSVTCDALEEDVGRLLRLMCIREDVVQLMIAQATEAKAPDKSSGPSVEQKKQAALARSQRRIQAAKRLFRDGDMEEAEYDAILREADEETQSWKRMTSERERVEYELRAVVEMLIKLAAIWDAGDLEQRQSLIQSLFTHIIYDLDTRRIVNFKLKPWVERFVELRLETEKTEKGALNPRDVRWSRRDSNPRHQI